MCDQSYNGWTNYKSWLVALWLDNEQGSQEAAREMAMSCDSDMAGGEAIKAWLNDNGDFPTEGMSRRSYERRPVARRLARGRLTLPRRVNHCRSI